MRNTVLTTFLIIFLTNVFYGQENDDVLTDIKDQMEVIDSYTEFDTFFLDPEEFLDKMPDNAAELNGYYEHERLKKIIRKVGTRSADVLTTFYFWNDQLIHVSYKQKPYLTSTSSNGQNVLDYSSTYTKYESKHYFNKGEEVATEKIGAPMAGIALEEEFVSYANKMKALLDNKFYNRAVYEALQGRWIFIQNTEDYIIFEGTIRFNFYNGKFANRLKTRIEDGVLECFFPMDDRIYRYKIENVDENILTLIDLFSKEEFAYAKVEN